MLRSAFISAGLLTHKVIEAREISALRDVDEDFDFDEEWEGQVQGAGDIEFLNVGGSNSAQQTTRFTIDHPKPQIALSKKPPITQCSIQEMATQIGSITPNDLASAINHFLEYHFNVATRDGPQGSRQIIDYTSTLQPRDRLDAWTILHMIHDTDISVDGSKEISDTARCLPERISQGGHRTVQPAQYDSVLILGDAEGEGVHST